MTPRMKNASVDTFTQDQGESTYYPIGVVFVPSLSTVEAVKTWSLKPWSTNLGYLPRTTPTRTNLRGSGKAGLHVTLAPLNPKDATPEVAPMTKDEIVGLARQSPPGPILGLVVLEENTPISDVPHEVLPLLTEFSDIFPDDIPAGLPLMRDIQHCIDFIPGATIPTTWHIS
ncbi:hypothetical protein Tco_1186330 [Tanacetum coccineum]